MDIDDVGGAVEMDIPHMFDDHVSRQRTMHISHHQFQQRILLGSQLNTIAGNLEMGVAGGVATAIAMRLYRLALDGVTGLTAASK